MTDQKPAAIELPCTVCGRATAEITPPVLGAVTRYALVKLMGKGGAEVDTDSPTFGFTPAQVAEVLGVRCIPCVDGATPAAPVTQPE